MRTHAVQNPVLFLCLTDFSQQTAGSHAQYLESTSPTQNVGLHVGLCSADSAVFQMRNVRRFVTSESPSLSLSLSSLFLFPSFRPSAPCTRTFLVSSPPENVAAGAWSGPVLIYWARVRGGIASSVPACTLLF